MIRSNKLDVLVFDFFGVICSEVAPFWLARYFSPSDAIAIKRDIVGRADTGEISQEELFKQLGELSGQTASSVVEQWMQHVLICDPIVKLLDEYSQRFRLALLTNSPSPFVRQILEFWNLSSRFESIVVSSEVALAKPDPRIYMLMLERIQATPAQCLMIDDNLQNINGAEAVGMRGHHFLDEPRLRKTLYQLSVKI